MALGSINHTAIDLLDWLAARSSGAWVRRWEVEHSCSVLERTARRGWTSLREFGLVETQRARDSAQPKGRLILWVRVTPLGQALISARYFSQSQSRCFATTTAGAAIDAAKASR